MRERERGRERERERKESVFDIDHDILILRCTMKEFLSVLLDATL